MPLACAAFLTPLAQPTEESGGFEIQLPEGFTTTNHQQQTNRPPGSWISKHSTSASTAYMRHQLCRRRAYRFSRLGPRPKNKSPGSWVGVSGKCQQTHKPMSSKPQQQQTTCKHTNIRPNPPPTTIIATLAGRLLTCKVQTPKKPAKRQTSK